MSDIGMPGATVDEYPGLGNVHLGTSSIPLATSRKDGVWAILNLALAALCVTFATFRLIAASARRRRMANTGHAAHQDAENKQRSRLSVVATVAAPILAAASVVLFLLVEDMRLAATVFIDGWTPLFAIIALAEVALAIALRFARSKNMQSYSYKAF
jgi:HAMP domain-containing protein